MPSARELREAAKRARRSAARSNKLSKKRLAKQAARAAHESALIAASASGDGHRTDGDDDRLWVGDELGVAFTQDQIWDGSLRGSPDWPGDIPESAVVPPAAAGLRASSTAVVAVASARAHAHPWKPHPMVVPRRLRPPHSLASSGGVQYGLFARNYIPPRTDIIEYTGFVTDDARCSTTSDYIMRLQGRLSVDAEIAGNDARFINDFRGIAKQPNVELVLTHGASEGVGTPPRMIVRSGAYGIPRGAELLLTYGKGFWTDRASVHERSAPLADRTDKRQGKADNGRKDSE